MSEAALTDSTTAQARSEEHTSELQSQSNLVCRLLLEKKYHMLLEAKSTRTLICVQSFHNNHNRTRRYAVNERLGRRAGCRYDQPAPEEERVPEADPRL